MSEHNNKNKYGRYSPPGYPTHYRRKDSLGQNIKLSLEYRRLSKEIADMDRRLDDFVLRSTDYFSLVIDAYSSNIHRSVSMEGNPLTLAEVRRTSGRYINGERMERTPGPEQEILNHLSSHFEELDKAFELPWTVDTVLRIHRLLTEGTDIEGTPGEFRTEEMDILAKDGEEEFVCMIPIHPQNIRDAMSSLMSWLETSPYDPVITSVVFFHEFESIHPFADGNGRTGRTAFQILLQKLGLRNCRLCRFEEKILGSLDLYYQLLGYTDHTLDYGPLISYIAEALHSAYADAVEEFGRKDALKDMDETTKTIARMSKERGWFSVSDAARWVPSVKRQTVRDKLNRLTEEDILEAEGNTASKRYRFRDPFRREKDAIRERRQGNA